METQTEDREMNCCDHSHGRKRRCVWIVVKIIVSLLVLAVVFAAGMAIGKAGTFLKFGMMGNNDGQFGMQNLRYQMVNGDFGKPGVVVMKKWREENKEDAPNKVFGAILKIEGVKITVLDNGGKERVVLSNSDTLIITQKGEISLSELKTGQDINAFGKLDKDGGLIAETISVSNQ